MDFKVLFCSRAGAALGDGEVSEIGLDAEPFEHIADLSAAARDARERAWASGRRAGVDTR